MLRFLKRNQFVWDNLKFFVKFLGLMTSFPFGAQASGLRDAAPTLHGETFHGYFDLPTVNKSGELILYHRSTRESHANMVIVGDNEDVRYLRPCSCWNYQVGNLAQFIGEDTIIFNEQISERVVAVMVHLATGMHTEFDHALGCVCGERGFVTNSYGRLSALQPSYRLGIVDSAQSGDIFFVDVRTGVSKLVVSHGQLQNMAGESDNWSTSHFRFNETANSCLFILRTMRSGLRHDILVEVSLDGRNLKIVDSCYSISHFTITHDNQIFYFKQNEVGLVGTWRLLNLGEVNPKGVDRNGVDGHPIYLNKEFWVDSYPSFRGRVSIRKFVISDLSEKHVTSFVSHVFRSPFERCDFHPCFCQSTGRIFGTITRPFGKRRTVWLKNANH